MPTINKIEVEGTTYDLEDTSAEGKFVALTGAQTVAGSKTFTDKTTVQNGQLDIKSTNITDGTAPSANNYENAIVFKDSADNVVGTVRTPFYTNGNQVLQMFAEMPAKSGRNESAVYNYLTLGLNPDTTKYVSVADPEPWRKALQLNCVKTDLSSNGTLATGGGIHLGNGNGVGNSGTAYGYFAANDTSIYLCNALDGGSYSEALAKIQWNFVGSVSNDGAPYLRYRYYVPSTSSWSNWVSPYYHSQIKRDANTVLAAPNGSNGEAKFRALDSDDIPALATSKITSGSFSVARGGTGRATLTDNAILAGNATSAINMIATKSGALYATAANGAATFGTLPIAQGGTGTTSVAAHSVLIGSPTNGTNGAPTWRGLQAADIPNLAASKITSGTLPIGRGGTGCTQTNSASGTTVATTTSSQSGAETYIEKWGNVVMFTFTGLKLATALANNSTSPTLMTLASAYRPPRILYGTLVGAFTGRAHFSITTGGALTIRNQTGASLATTVQLSGTITYIVD